MGSTWPMRALGTSVFAACFALAVSCVSVLDLSNYAGAAQVLCDHLQQCFGASGYDCVEHVQSGLAEATPEEREAWLASILDDECVAQCSAGKACLDAIPVCNAPAEGCAQEEQCCGFLDKAQLCQDGACCRDDGQLCEGPGECCTDCDPLTGTCGGEPPCQPQGEPCEDPGECCSDNCLLPEGQCGFRCREHGEDCTDGDDCCSGQCESSRCACKEELTECSEHTACCLGQCYLGQCNADPGCLAPNQDCLDDPLACCQLEDAEMITCVPGENRCCLPDGASLGGTGDGLSDFCCSNAADGPTCCGDVMQRCTDDSCCEGLNCRAAPNNGDSFCCRTPMCADACVAQPFPLTASTTGNGCDNLPNKISLGCLNEICGAVPVCCCDQWLEFCADMVKAKSAVPGNPCMGTCSVITQP
ncbi:MAG: hypothetical protein RIF41_11840 [Polyangiaceae bacterium]